MDKEILIRYEEEFADELNDYVKETKCEEINKCHHWQDMLEIIEQHRVDTIALIEELYKHNNDLNKQNAPSGTWACKELKKMGL